MLYGVREDEDEGDAQGAIGLPSSPNPLFDPRRNRGAQRNGGGGVGGSCVGDCSATEKSTRNEFANALYSGAEFERSKQSTPRVEIVSRGIPQRCVVPLGNRTGFCIVLRASRKSGALLVHLWCSRAFPVGLCNVARFNSGRSPTPLLAAKPNHQSCCLGDICW